jgi:hypothetical protein
VVVLLAALESQILLELAVKTLEKTEDWKMEDGSRVHLD